MKIALGDDGGKMGVGHMNSGVRKRFPDDAAEGNTPVPQGPGHECDVLGPELLMQTGGCQLTGLWPLAYRFGFVTAHLVGLT